MTEVPGSEWSEGFDLKTAENHVPFPADWRLQAGEVRHTFTHFHLRLAVFRADCKAGQLPRLDESWWSPADKIDSEALPTVMRKVLASALG